jgi:hypothetical protein
MDPDRRRLGCIALAFGPRPTTVSTVRPPRSGECRQSSPHLEPIDDQTVTEGDTLVVIPTATDPDADPIRYSCLHLPQAPIFR